MHLHEMATAMVLQRNDIGGWGQVVLTPVVLGAVLNGFFPRAMQRIAPFAALVAVFTIALICGSVVAANAAAIPSAGGPLLLAVICLHSGSTP